MLFTTPFPSLLWDCFFFLSFPIESSLWCPDSLGNGVCTGMWPTYQCSLSLKKPESLSSSNYHKPGAPQLMLEFCLAWACVSPENAVMITVILLSVAALLWLKTSFLDVICHILFLQSFQALFGEIPWTLRGGVWYLCPILGWVLHHLTFSGKQCVLINFLTPNWTISISVVLSKTFYEVT